MSELDDHIPPDELGSRAARGARSTAVWFTAGQIVTFGFYIVYARLTTPAVLGVVAAGSILIAVGEMLSESSMGAAVVQRRDRLQEAASTAFAATLVGGVGFSLLAVGLAPVIGMLFDSTEAGLVAAVLAPTILLGSVSSIPGALLQRALSTRRWTIVEPVAIVSQGVVTIVLLAVGLDVWGLVAGTYAQVVTRATAMWLVVPWRPQRSLVSRAMWIELSRFARHILAAELLREAMRVATTAAVGRGLGAAALGQFRFAFRFVWMLATPVLAANAWTMQATLVRLEDPERRRSAILTSVRVVAFLAFPLSAAFVPLGEALAVTLLGAEWRGAGPMMAALAGFGAFLSMEAVGSEVLKGSGQPRAIPWIHAFWAVSCVVLIVVLAPHGGAAAGIAWSVSTVATALLALDAVTRAVPGLSRLTVLRAFAAPLLAAAATATALTVTQRLIGWTPQPDLETVLWLIVQAVVGLVAYVSLAVLLDRTSVTATIAAVRVATRRGRPAPSP